MASALTVTEQSVVDAVVAGTAFGDETLPGAGVGAPTIRGALIRELLAGEHGELAGRRLRINGVIIRGDVDLSHRDWRGELDLAYCRIDGNISVAHATFRGKLRLTGARMRRFDASYAIVEGKLVLHDTFVECGMVGTALQVKGALDLSKARFVAPVEALIEVPGTSKRGAVELFRARLHDVFLRGAVIVGGFYAKGCVVERDLRFRDAWIIPLKRVDATASAEKAPFAVDLQGASIGGGLYLGDVDESGGRCWGLAGSVNLARVTCETLFVEADAIAGRDLVVDHLRYRQLAGVDLEHWLELLEATHATGSQPYVQFAAHCHDLGRTDLERRALIALQQAETRALPGSRTERIRRRAWQWSLAYGYKPGRALLWLLACAASSALLVGLAGDFLVTECPAGAAAGPCSDKPPETVVALALDGLLPFAGLGVARTWTASPDGTAQTLAMIVFVCLKFAAWGFAALGLAAVTGVLKRT